jgi:predicted Zn-dependent peptidase
MVSDRVVRSTLDGIPLYVVATEEATTATLMFGVGMRDESPRTAGLAHLVEHLVMRSVGRVRIEHNAQTGVDNAQFYASGPRDKVFEFITNVCTAIRNLADVDEDSVAAERRTVAAEIGEGGETAGTGPLMRRFGSAGLGLLDFGQPAHRSFTQAQVADFARSWLHRANAALVVLGSVPVDFSLDLPDGATPQRTPQPRVPLAFPVWSPSSFAPVGITFDVDFATGSSSVFGALLELMLMDTLRHEKGIIYSVSMNALEVDDDSGVVLIALDPDREKIDETLRGAIDVLRRVAAGDVTDDDLEHVRELVLAGPDEIGFHMARSEAMASAHLRGMTWPELDDAIHKIRNTSTSDLARMAEKALASIVVNVMADDLEEETVSATGITRALRPHSLEGVGFREMAGRALRNEVELLSPRLGKGQRGSQLMISADTITLIAPDEIIEVPLADVVLVARFPDGAAFHLETANGWDLLLRPQQWKDKGGFIARALETIPKELFFDRETDDL